MTGRSKLSIREERLIAIFGIEYVVTTRAYFGVEAADEYEAVERFNKWRLSSEDVDITINNTDNIDSDYYINNHINIERLEDYDILTEEKYRAL